MGSRKKLLLVLGILAAVIVCIYLGFSFYFMSHFYSGTHINGADFSMKTAEDADKYLQKQIAVYTLTIIPKEGEKEEVAGADISMKYVKNKKLKQTLEEQNAFLWPSMFFGDSSIKADLGFTLDEKKLEEKIEGLSCWQNEGKTDPQSAKPEFNGEKFVVKEEVLGTKVDQEKTKKAITDAVFGLYEEISLEKEDCYQKPKYTSDSKEVAVACDTLNQYCKASITYDMAPAKEVVDGKLIAQWLTWDDNMNVTFHEDKVGEYMNNFAAKYETLYASRPLTTPWGKATEVSGGTYGWAIDEASETQALLASIKAGETVTKEPVYEQRAATHEAQDWGKTFIEVDLSAQYMWYIVDGNVAFESAVVTGKPYDHSTPSGVYDILLMSLNTTLVGNIVPETGEPEYRTPVDYWMQVTWGGVGFHDATWQPAFGGDLYWSIGSHGCINMPLDAAGALYSMISTGTPVVMHY